MRTHYAAMELAGLPGLPGSERAVQLRADREAWKWQKRPGRGGGKEYALASLPLETRKHLQSRHLDTVAATLVPAVAGTAAEQLPMVLPPSQMPQLAELTKHQHEVMNARMVFINLIENRPKGQSIKACQRELAAKSLPGGTCHALALVANDRKGKGGRTLSQGTIMRWWSEYIEVGKKPSALAPRDADSRRVARDAVLVHFCRDHKPGCFDMVPAELPVWLPWFLDAYRTGSKPSINAALTEMEEKMPAGMALPSYDQIVRITRKIPEVYLQKYRLTGAEYKAICGFNHRDFSMDDPFTVGQIDGHSFKAYVAHPTTGAHFHPEVCGIICMTTKVLAGWSTGLAESATTVADAYRHACTVNDKKPWGSIFAMVEPDLGSGNMAKVNSDELTGRFARVGTTFLPPEVGGNPQGHGGIERSNQSIWIRAAKRLETYTGKDMDRVTRKRIYTRLEQDLKKVEKAGMLGVAEKTSKLLLSWTEFLEFLHEEALRYNNTPHSALPKIADPTTGRRRHMSPFECLADRIARGWQPTILDDELLEHTFMPHVRIRVNRCEFRLHGNQYHSYELHQWHDREMIAAYDIHNPEHVYVLDLDERLVTIAKWNGNRIAGRPVAEKELAIERRAKGRTKLLERKLDMIKAETRQTVAIEHSPELEAKRITFTQTLTAPVETVETTPIAPVVPARAKIVPLYAADPDAFVIPEDSEGRWNLWCDLKERILSEDTTLGEPEISFYTSFRNSPTWRAFSRTRQFK